MKNFINKNSKLIIAFVIGCLISLGTVFAANTLYANKVSVDTTNMPALGDTSNVNDALTYLYRRASESGLVGTGNHALIPTAFKNHSKKKNVYITYLDPTNLTKKCTAADVVSTIGTKSGCMKWYVFDSDNETYTMILDHNTTAAATWADSMSAVASLKTTPGWNANLNVRLISAREIAEITHADAALGWYPSYKGNYISDLFYLDQPYYGAYTYNDQNSKYQYDSYGVVNLEGYSTASMINSKGGSSFSWLFDYTKDCTASGCNVADTNTEGYWTSSMYNSSDSWFIDNLGKMDRNSKTINTKYGVRPVIDIPKYIF